MRLLPSVSSLFPSLVVVCTILLLNRASATGPGLRNSAHFLRSLRTPSQTNHFLRSLRSPDAEVDEESTYVAPEVPEVELPLRESRGIQGNTQHFLRSLRSPSTQHFLRSLRGEEGGDNLDYDSDMDLIEAEKRSNSHFLRAMRARDSHFLRSLRSPAGNSHFLRSMRSPGNSHFLRALRASNFFFRDDDAVPMNDEAEKRSNSHFLRSL